jgi:hypothetical protein
VVFRWIDVFLRPSEMTDQCVVCAKSVNYFFSFLFFVVD